MRNRNLTQRIWIGAAGMFAVLVFVGCSSPFGAETGDETARTLSGGGVEVSTAQDDGIGALTVFPELDRSTIDSYHVVLVDGPEGATQPDPLEVTPAAEGEFPEGVRFVDVVPGNWTVEIDARDAESEILLRGEDEISVTAGSFTPANVTLRYLGSGEGAYEVSVEWSASNAVEHAEYRTVVETGDEPTDGSNGVWQDAEIESGSGNVQSITVAENPRNAGSFWLTVRLDGDVVVDELVYVYKNITTRHAISFLLDNEKATQQVVETVEQVVEDAINEDPDDPDWTSDEGEFGHLANGAGAIEFPAFDQFAVVKLIVRLDSSNTEPRRVTVSELDGEGEIEFGDGTPQPEVDVFYVSDEFTRIAFGVPADTEFSIEFAGGGTNWTFGDFEVDLSYTDDTDFDSVNVFEGDDGDAYEDLIWGGVLGEEN